MQLLIDCEADGRGRGGFLIEHVQERNKLGHHKSDASVPLIPLVSVSGVRMCGHVRARARVGASLHVGMCVSPI